MTDNEHTLVAIVPWASVTHTGTCKWACSCGEYGIAVGDIYAMGASSPFVTGEERARSAHKLHQAKRAPAWPFPSVSYDYERAGVGTKPRDVPLDREEMARAIDENRHQSNARKTNKP
jgi:hypothetical protein